MSKETVEARPLDEGSVTLRELAEQSGLDEREVRELVDYGVFGSVDFSHSVSFSTRYVVVARKAYRLRRDFELDAHAVSVLLGFIDRMDELQRELMELRAHVSRVR